MVLRIAGRIEELKSRVRIALLSAYPYRSSFIAMADRRRRQHETRLALGLGRPGADTLVFSRPDGSPMSPDNLSRDRRRFTAARGSPRVMAHALPHGLASAPIAGGRDVLTVSRRLGHGSPVVTLTIYAHLFDKTDTKGATMIEAALRTGAEL